MIKISRNYVESALAGYADLLIGKDERPLVDPAEWDDHVETLHDEAERRGNLPYLKLALEVLLTGADAELLECRDKVGYVWSAAELRRIFEYAYRKLWPEAQLPTRAPAGVELVGMDSDSWTRLKPEQAAELAALELKR